MEKLRRRRLLLMACAYASCSKTQRPRTETDNYRFLVFNCAVNRRRRRTLVLALVWRARMYKRRTQRRWAVRPLHQLRPQHGDWHTKIPHMRANDPEKFFEYFRMSPERFDHVLELVSPHIQRYSLNDSICPRERMALTLRYLATGCDMRTISFAFLVSPSSVSLIIRETCQVLWAVLKDRVFRQPSRQEWERIAKEFDEQWNFPHCVGAIDGKHCVVQAFPKTGSDWYNYKQTFSMVLLGVSDANYKFVAVDIGGRGRRSDGGLFRHSTFGQMFLHGELDFPPPRQLPAIDREVPYVIVADEAFSLTPNMMRPFPGTFLPDDQIIFNYRLSRARRVVENAFGVLCARWRVLRRRMICSKTTAKAVIQACVVLHNLQVMNESRVRFAQRQYIPVDYVDVETQDGVVINGLWRQEVENSSLNSLTAARVRMGPRNYTADAAEVRELFTDYFLGHGQVHWQWKHLPVRR